MVVTTSPVLNLRPSSSRPKTRLGNQLAKEHSIQWRTASPLWPAAANNGELSRPEILRFTTDTFMEDFLKVATQAPERLGEWVVTRETWRLPAPVPPLPPAAPVLPSAAPDPDEETLKSEPLKLFQSTHQRYYLVTANLVCRTPGFPDRMLKTNQDEQVSFVLRRSLSPETDKPPQEHALVEGEWQALSTEQTLQLMPGEQQFPMFPTTYTQKNGYQRRLFTGLIPVSARETYMNAARRGNVAVATAEADTATMRQSRIEQILTVLEMDVIQPWRAINQQRILAEKKLEESHEEIGKDIADEEELEAARNEALEAIDETRDGLQTASWYVLLDFAYFLDRYCPQVWQKPGRDANAPDPNSPNSKALLKKLKEIIYKPYVGGFSTNVDILKDKFRGVNQTSGATSLITALNAVYDAHTALEQQTAPYTAADTEAWPSETFLLCSHSGLKLVHTTDAFGNLTAVDTLKNLVAAVLADDPSVINQRIPLIPISQQISATAQVEDYINDEFTIRCVFQRPHCPPSIQPTVVSQPTQSFRMASYFDPDAPSRPIRIPMPVDTSPAGLRKFAKNTAFVLSDSLSCQIEKAGSLTFGDIVLSVLPWPFRKKINTDGASCSKNQSLSIGKICTLSIPIITICALILLMIIVKLLDIIFHWVPYLIFCLPLPGLKSKEE